MQQGWITLHRSLLDNFLWCDKPFTKGQAWVDLLLNANHEDKKIMFDGSVVEVKRGEKVTSIRQLSERWGWSTTKTKKFLNVLQSEKMLTYFSNSKKTTYTVVNYNKYQDLNNSKSNTEKIQKKHRKNTEVTQKNTNNNDNNDNNDNKIINILSIDKIFVPLIEEWNKLPDVIPKITTFKKDTQRYKMLNQRINEYGQDKVLKAIQSIRKSSWLLGKNNRGWVATFEWFVKPNSFIKVLEGNYLDKKIIDKKGRYIEERDILTDEEKKEREKNEYSGIKELFDNY